MSKLSLKNMLDKGPEQELPIMQSRLDELTNISYSFLNKLDYVMFHYRERHETIKRTRLIEQYDKMMDMKWEITNAVNLGLNLSVHDALLEKLREYDKEVKRAEDMYHEFFGNPIPSNEPTFPTLSA